MKIKFLLPLLLLSSLTLGGCNSPKGDGGKSSEGGQSGETSEGEGSGSTTEEKDELNPYADYPEVEGETDAFPEEAFNNFLDYFGYEIELPVPGGTNYLFEQTMYNGYANFYAFCEDEGTIGTDSIEDTYKAALETAGFTVDDTQYDAVGYVVLDERYEDFELVFYNVEDEDGNYFYFDCYGPSVAPKCKGFPAQVVLEYLQAAGLNIAADGLVLPNLDDERIWTYYEAQGWFSSYLDLQAEGTEAEVNAYVALAEAAGWVVDDYSDLFEMPAFYLAPTEDSDFDIFVGFEDGIIDIQVSVY